MEEIAHYLGHANVNVTRSTYARFSPEYLRTAAAILEYDDLGGTSVPTRSIWDRAEVTERIGGRGWDRTSDPYDVNVVLSR